MIYLSYPFLQGRANIHRDMHHGVTFLVFVHHTYRSDLASRGIASTHLSLKRHTDINENK